MTQAAPVAPEFDFIRFLGDYGRLDAFQQPDMAGQRNAPPKPTAAGSTG